MSLALLLCAALAPRAQDITAPTGSIHYTVSPWAVATGVASLEVEIRFVGNSRGQSIFTLPSDAMGGHERWKYLSHFEGRGVRIVARANDQLTLLYRPGATVAVKYLVRSAYAENPTGGYPFEGPVILSHWLATLGEFIFIVPENAKTAPVSYQWKPGLTQWKSLSNLDHPGAEEALTAANLLESSIIAGQHLKVVERPIFGGILQMGAVGSWRVPLDDYADLEAKISSSQRAIWGDLTGPLTITTLALAGSGQGSAGVGGYRGFAHYVSASTPASQLTRDIAHEHIHIWIPGRLGEMPRGNAESALYWFSEGFTEFYTQHTLLRAGIWSLEDFIGDLNNTLYDYAANPNNSQPNAWTSARFWTDSAVQRIPYLRGNLFAYLLDNRIRQVSGHKIGLDQVIFRMRDHWLNAPADHRPTVLDNFRQSYQELLGNDEQLDALIESYITKGQFIRLPVDMFGQCVTFEVSEPPSQQTWQAVHLAALDERQRETCAKAIL
jgi:predicted metalloprotease with PDZ domain